MFKARVPDGTLIKNMIMAISTLLDEATFDLTPDGIKIRSMDPSRVAMVDFEWKKTVFEEYVCSEPTKMCINVREMLKLLRRAKRDESVELSLDKTNARLQIIIRGKYTRTFKMPTLETTEESVPTPKVTFNVRVKVTTEALRQAIEDASLVSDHVRIEVDNEKMVMHTTGSFMAATIELDRGSDALLDLEVKKPSKATFSLNYLTDILRAAAPTSEIASMEFSSDMPLLLDFQQPNEGKLTFYLAPRIEID